MNRIIIICMVLLAIACKKDHDTTGGKSDLMNMIADAQNVLSNVEEGEDPGDHPPGSMQLLQDKIDWANYILADAGTDEAYVNAKAILADAIEAFKTDVVRSGIPLFSNGSYFNLGQVKDLLPHMDQFTIECTVKLKDLDADGGSGLGSFITADDGTGGILLRYNQSGGVEAYAYNGDWFGTSSNGGALKSGEWYRLGMAFDGISLRLYINGELAGSNTNGTKFTPTIAPASPFFLGMSRNFQFDPDDKRSMHGNIKEVRFWSRSLSQAEIVDLSEKQLTGTEEGLTAYWPLDVNLGTQVKDKTGKFTAAGTNIAWE